MNIQLSIIRFFSLSVLLLSTSIIANAGTLVSVVNGDYIVPPTAFPEDSVANGGFFISGYGRGNGIGDGADENTVWFHSFRLDRPQWKAFITADPASINRATLELRYTPTHRAAYNDFIRIAGLRPIPISEFSGFINGPLDPRTRRINISVNLLQHYSSEEILSAMKNSMNSRNWIGNILMQYADDATIHSATLTLEY